MVLKIFQAAADRFFPYQYAYHILVAIVAVATIRAFSQGRTTNRERDLHNRTFLVTGAFTPTGLTLLQSLAKRGAKIIALSPHPIDSPTITILINLFRTTFNNEHIYAEQCNLTNPSDIRKFCMRFLTEGEDGTDTTDSKTDNNAKPKVTTDKRLDGIIFAHEYQHTGIFSLLRNKSSATIEQEQAQRESNSLATFLIITLLLPALLVAPVERDIRIINVVNPFYAAAAASVRANKTFDPSFKLSMTSTTPTKPNSSIFLTEGFRSLRTIILTRHLQRIFDALPKPQIPKTEEGSSTIPVISPRMQRSNIVATSVSPGLSRVDTISRLFNADWKMVENTEDGSVARKVSWFGVFLYILLLPFLLITTKTPSATIQSILHALFLPTPFKVLSQSITTSTESEPQSSSPSSSPPASLKPRLTHEELLKPGALYAECAVVNLPLSIPTPDEQPSDHKPNPAPTTTSKGDKDTDDKDNSGSTLREEVLQIDDDGEYGGELAGRVVWEAYETALKVWERA